jgi:hypothetical protein
VRALALSIPLWILLAVPTAECMRRRGRDAWFWFVLVTVLGIVGLISWAIFITRPAIGPARPWGRPRLLTLLMVVVLLTLEVLLITTRA